MEQESIELGKNYACVPVGFEEAIVGEVISKMTNCAVVKVVRCSMKDESQNEEKANMVVAKYETFQLVGE